MAVAPKKGAKVPPPKKARWEEDEAPSNESDIPSVINFDEDVEDAERPDPLPPGTYPATVTGVEVKVSQKGNKFANVLWFISPDAFPIGFDSAPDGVTVRGMVMLEDNAASRYRLKTFLHAIGLRGARQIDTSAWKDCEARVVVQHEKNPNDGLDYPRVRNVLPVE